MTPFSRLLQMQADGAASGVVLPDDWLQGRTAYGGLSAALSLAAARAADPGLPPLRTAQVCRQAPRRRQRRLARRRARAAPHLPARR